MTDNFKQIKGLLEFRSDDDFYFLQILQRKKDHKDGMKVNGTNNNSRLVKAYYVKSLEQFEFIEPEVKALCGLFNARAGINLNRRSFKRMQLQHLKKITDQLLNKDHNKSHRAYNTVCGAYNDDSDKKWILDIDDGEISLLKLFELPKVLGQIEPIGDKIIAKIPSKNGYHLIVKPFNIMKLANFSAYKLMEIHKNNPTNLYIP